jgi:hypothetical protein
MKLTKSVLAICFAVLCLVFMTACASQPPARAIPQEPRRAQSAKAAPEQKNSPALTQMPASTAKPAPESKPEPDSEPKPEATTFSIAWISDTQVYTAADNDVFGRMTQWISDTQQEYNTLLTVHTGDIVFNAYREYEWQNSVAAFARLPEGMRILTSAGNHDLLPAYDPATPYLNHRPDTEFDTSRAFDEEGYVYYMTFQAGGVPVIVFSLSYGFEVGAADWVSETCKEYADHYAILCLHNYMNLGGYSSVGTRLIERVIKQSPNIRLVLCGHERGMAYIPEALDDDADAIPDRMVHQMMMNVQDDMQNGVGYLRLLRLDLVSDTLEVVTYSPILERYGYESYCGDRFGERKLLGDAGIREFFAQEAS